MTLFLLFFGAYLLGAVPFGFLIAKAYGIDITQAGSGNIGATNVRRVLGQKLGKKGDRLGYLVFGLDVLKSLVPTLFARALIEHSVGPFDAQFVWFGVGVAAVTGHCLSPFLGFKGGKGISTALGAILGASPIVAGLCFLLFLILLVTTHYMAISSVVAVASVVPFSLVVPHQTYQLLPVYLILATFVAYRHRKNFQRLKDGSEPKFYFSRNRAAGAKPAGEV